MAYGVHMMQGPPVVAGGLDLNYVVSQLLPLIPLVVVLAIAATVLRMVLRSPFGDAIADQVRERTRRRYGLALEAEPPRVAALEQQVTQLRDQVSELAERLDFAERLLAERRERKVSAGQ
jgi:hypothetical protein